MGLQVKVQGSCHCQAVRFRIESTVEERTTCNCSLCRRRATQMIKVHESEFFLLSGKEQLRQYQFHTHTAIHHFCGVCGIYPFHRKRVTPDYYGINVNCLDHVDLSALPLRETHGADMD